jgi:hypothetical protein
MSKRHRSVRSVSRIGWMVLFISVDALAIGGEGNQGVLLAGQGIDWQRSGTELQPLAPLTANDFPPPKGTYIVSAAEVVVLGGCTSLSDLSARCPVTASLLTGHSPTQLCGRWLKNKTDPTYKPEPTWMYAINAKPDKRGGFIFQSSGTTKDLVFACSVEAPNLPTDLEWAALGAVGKCLLWPLPTGSRGYPPQSGDRGDQFNTCVRTVRADYCGNGVAHTKDGTRIDLYAKPPPHQLQPPFLLEANWDEKGAICVIHARYLSLSPQCQREVFRVVLEHPRGKEGAYEFTGTEYHCDPSRLRVKAETGNCIKDQEAAAAALSGGKLWDDSLLQ